LVLQSCNFPATSAFAHSKTLHPIAIIEEMTPHPYQNSTAALALACCAAVAPLEKYFANTIRSRARSLHPSAYQQCSVYTEKVLVVPGTTACISVGQKNRLSPALLHKLLLK